MYFFNSLRIYEAVTCFTWHFYISLPFLALAPYAPYLIVSPSPSTFTQAYIETWRKRVAWVPFTILWPYLTDSLFKPCRVLRGGGCGGSIDAVLDNLLLFLTCLSIRLLNRRERSGNILYPLSRQTVLVLSYGGQQRGACARCIYGRGGFSFTWTKKYLLSVMDWQNSVICITGKRCQCYLLMSSSTPSKPARHQLQCSTRAVSHQWNKHEWLLLACNDALTHAVCGPTIKVENNILYCMVWNFWGI